MLARAVSIASGSGEQVNFAELTRRVLCACNYCLEMKHGLPEGTYLMKSDIGSGMKATSQFRKANQATKGVPLSKKRAEFICKLADQKAESREDTRLASTLAVYQDLSASATLRSGLDWVSMLGSWLFLFYGCPYCFRFQLMST